VLTQRKTADRANKRAYEFAKRVFDVVNSLLALVLLCVPFLVICVLIRLSDGGSAFYVAQRVGKNGIPFGMYKFRTMVMHADSLRDMLTPAEYAEYKKEYKLQNDPRVTKIGRLLRKSSIDEFPQLINVIKGDMHFVGPRPLVEEETYLYGENREKLLSVKPGLTGYWQAYARNAVGYGNGKRQEMELFYVENRSFWMDIKIILATVVRVLRGEGAS